MSDTVANARRMLASLHGRNLAELSHDEQMALCRNGKGCVLCYGYGCGFEGQGPVNRNWKRKQKGTS